MNGINAKVNPCASVHRSKKVESTLADILFFLSSLISSFSSFLFHSFTLVLAFSFFSLRQITTSLLSLPQLIFTDFFDLLIPFYSCEPSLLLAKIPFSSYVQPYPPFHISRSHLSFFFNTLELLSLLTNTRLDLVSFPSAITKKKHFLIFTNLSVPSRHHRQQ
ncbi:MAG: hypothetical protein J3R72DRAFT_127823 [Linnemannia gamsii]|nr:MAG: hypothetical protein J3R72DRAFT_127823 [Linnemannia gamsii]